MKLLILTQKADRKDPVLGFFLGWLLEFSRHVEKITVVCLEKGETKLPENTEVLSLGKEKTKNRFLYVLNFYSYIWGKRKDYDAVFVHMNQEYVLLGGILWKLLGKKVFLWRNHLKGSFLTNISVYFSDRVYCTSPYSYTARFKKTKIMPVGIDTDFFKPEQSGHRRSHSVLFLGRIAPVKNADLFVEALKELRDKGVEFTATIAGGSLPKDAEYEKMIRAKAEAYGFSDKVKFMGPVTQEGALRLYREHAVYVNLTPAGSMDKTIFEASACGGIPVVANEALLGALPEQLIAKELNVDSVFKAISSAFDCRSDFREYVVREHSLKSLMTKLFSEMK